MAGMSSPPAPAVCVASTLAVLALLCGCGAEPRGSAAPSPLTDVRRHRTHIGLDAAAPADAALGSVTAARVTDSGRHVVVLDFVAPFIKVFDRSGRFQAAFLDKGGGPGEARGPTALAVSGDSLVLVVDPAQGILLFDLSGRLRGQSRINGLFALAAAAPCPGEWLVYGPRRAPGRGTGTATWLHRVRFTAPGAAEVRSSMSDTIAGRVGAGLAYGLVSDGDGAVLRHSAGAHPRVVRVPCSGEPRVLYRGTPAVEQPTSAPRRGSVQTSIRPGMRAPGGLASLGGSVVFAEKVFVGSHEDRLDLTMLAGGGTKKLSIARDYVLQDSRPGVGVLVSTSDPVPQVFLVSPEDFLSMFPAR